MTPSRDRTSPLVELVDDGTKCLAVGARRMVRLLTVTGCHDPRERTPDNHGIGNVKIETDNTHANLVILAAAADGDASAADKNIRSTIEDHRSGREGCQPLNHGLWLPTATLTLVIPLTPLSAIRDQ